MHLPRLHTLTLLRPLRPHFLHKYLELRCNRSERFASAVLSHGLVGCLYTLVRELEVGVRVHGAEPALADELVGGLGGVERWTKEVGSVVVLAVWCKAGNVVLEWVVLRRRA